MQPQFKVGDTRVIQGQQYVRNANGQWSRAGGEQAAPVVGPPLPPKEPTPPPSGFRYNPSGNLEPIPGGPKDPSRPEPSKAPTGYRFGPNGVLEPIPGGPEDPNKEGPIDASEGERKAAFLATRVAGGIQDISSVLETSDATKPTVQAEIVGGIFGSTARNFANSSDRQRIEAAQLDILDAALTLGTGAAYTPEQLENYRRTYFPQLGDSDDTVADKERRLRRLLGAARINAGKAAPMIDEAMAALFPKEEEQRRGAVEFGPQDLTDNFSPEQAKAWDAFIKNNPDFTEKELNAWAIGALGAPIDNAAEIVAARDEGLGVRPGSEGVANRVNEEKLQELQSQGGAGEFMHGVGDTATFGLTDEIRAATGAFGDSLRGKGSFGDLFNENLATERAYLNSISGSPAHIAGQVTGAVAIPVGLGSQTIRGLGKGNIVRGLAVEGGVQGTLYGAGSGEGVGGRTTNALAHGAIGSATGTAMGVAAPYAQKGINALANKMPGNRAAQEVAQNSHVIDAGQRRGVPVRQYDVRPSTQRDRANILQGDKGRQVIRDADAEDLSAMEGAVANDLGGRGDAPDLYQAGDAVQEGILASREATRNKAGNLYRKAHQQAAGVRINPQSAIRAIDQQIEELTAAGANTNSAQIKFFRDLRDDLTAEGGLTVEALRAQRTNLRGNINERNLGMTDAERRASIVLDAASDDLAQNLPEGAKATFREADNLWRHQANLKKRVIDKILGPNAENPKSAAATAKAVQNFAKSDPKRFRAMFAELDDAERAEVGAMIADSLGRNTKGEFSLATFLTHTGKGSGSKLDDRVARIVFGEDGFKAIKDLRVLANAKTEAASATNYSNTGGVVRRAGNSLRQVLLAALGFDAAGVAGGVAAPAAVSFLSSIGERRAAKLLTNPDFTKWLRNTPSTTNPRVIDRHFERLNSVAARGGFEGEARALQEYLASTYSPNRAAAQDENEQR